MRFWLIVFVACILGLATSCQDTPPTLMVLVLTATPDTTEAVTSGTATVPPTATTPPFTETPRPTPTPDPFPTPTISQIQVAEQPFERGRMFWIQPRRQIWVLINTGEGRGRWEIYDDTFEEGQPEFDPSIVPPGEGQYQPERGFGKLWRENEAVREALGWAITPDEFGYISPYEYHPGGYVTPENVYVPGPGYHILFSLYEEAYRFNEADQTWQLGRGND